MRCSECGKEEEYVSGVGEVCMSVSCNSNGASYAMWNGALLFVGIIGIIKLLMWVAQL